MHIYNITKLNRNSTIVASAKHITCNKGASVSTQQFLKNIKENIKCNIAGEGSKLLLSDGRSEHQNYIGSIR